MTKKSLDELAAAAVRTPDLNEKKSIAAKARTKVIQKPKKLGRPTRYNENIAATILKSLSEGKTLINICAELSLGIQSVYDWLRTNAAFAESYRLARQDMAQSLVDEMLDESRTLEPDKAMVGKVRAQVFQWVASRYSAQFADSKRIELKGEISHKHSHELSEGQRRRIAESWLISREADTPLIEATTSGPDLETGVSVQLEEPTRERPRRKAAISMKPKVPDDGW